MSDGEADRVPAGAPAPTSWWRRRLWRRLPAGSAQARATIAGVLGLQVLANGLGAVVVGLYIRFLFPGPTTARQTELNLVVFSAYLLLFAIVALPINALLLRRAVVWVRNGTPPTARQRRLVLWLPGLETASAGITWLGAALIFGVLNRPAQRVAIGVALAGMITCAVLYLLLEGHFRPVFAMALVDADLPENRRDVLPRLMLAWILGSGIPLIGIGLVPFLDAGQFDRGRLPWLAGAGVVGGGVVMGAAAVSVARPLNRVRRALREVELGNLDVVVPVDDLGELGRLAEGVNDLVAGLREREQLRDMFGRQVGQAALAQMTTNAERFADHGELRRVTVLFVDLQGYTRFSEGRSPEDVVAMLNRFFRVVVAVVNRDGGWVNKFEGDAALCMFGAPQDDPDHAAHALRAAASLPRELARVDGVLPAGIGVATGEVIAGFVGTSERFEYTVIGDVVNVASRLCDLAKEQRGGVLAASSTIIAAGQPDDWAAAGRVRMRGRRERVEGYAPAAPRRRRRPD